MYVLECSGGHGSLMAGARGFEHEQEWEGSWHTCWEYAKERWGWVVAGDGVLTSTLENSWGPASLTRSKHDFGGRQRDRLNDIFVLFFPVLETCNSEGHTFRKITLIQNIEMFPVNALDLTLILLALGHCGALWGTMGHCGLNNVGH